MAAVASPDFGSSPIATGRWAVRNLDLFRELSEAEIDELLRRSRVVEFGRGEHVCMSGVRHSHAYLVKEGTVRMVAASPTGKRLTLALLKPGELIGDLDLGEPGEPGESAETVTPAQLLQVPVDLLRELVDRHPEMGLQITKLIGKRRTQIVNRIRDVMFLTVPQRLARLALRLADEYPGTTKLGRRFVNLRLTHADLADLVGSNREAVSATLAQMRRQKSLGTTEGRLVLLNEERLRLEGMMEPDA